MEEAIAALLTQRNIDEAAKALVSRMFADGVELMVRSSPRG